MISYPTPKSNTFPAFLCAIFDTPLSSPRAFQKSTQFKWNMVLPPLRVVVPINRLGDPVDLLSFFTHNSPCKHALPNLIGTWYFLVVYRLFARCTIGTSLASKLVPRQKLDDLLTHPCLIPSSRASTFCRYNTRVHLKCTLANISVFVSPNDCPIAIWGARDTKVRHSKINIQSQAFMRSRNSRTHILATAMNSSVFPAFKSPSFVEPICLGKIFLPFL